MGGRETLYVGVTRPDLFGYIGAACPAPGVTPGTDSFMAHPGNMAEADFKIKDTANYPYLWLITGGTNDTVVGQFPQSYHNILTTNGQDHIWQEIQGGGHDGSCVVPMMYNFMKGIFKVSGSSSSGTQPSQSTPATTTPPTTKPAGGVDISWIDPTKPMVAISFDDGAVGNAPTDTSMRIINALADSGFHSTFFYVGDWINNSGKEEEVKYAFSKGMEIANHTTSHPDLSTKSANEIRNEYDSCEAKLKNIIGTSPSKLLRLPYLASNQTVQQTLNDAPLITCSIDTGDWNNTSTYDMIDKIVKAKENGSLNGAIVLAHETYDTTAEAIEYLAPYLKGEGWQIVTVSEMFAVKNQQLNGGQIYTKVN
ncbi:MAG: polysaccharide deacetylase family protein [Ruminococcus sp.]|nr:polysaccharide deacetylase family protein [Ruminococcus sp.]